MGLLRLVICAVLAVVLSAASLGSAPTTTKNLKGQVHKAEIKAAVPQPVTAAKPVAGVISAAAATKTQVAAPQAAAGSNQTSSSQLASSEPRKQLLRLCNAHPAGDLEVFLDDGETGHLSLTESGGAIPHRQCRETTQVMRVGDYLEFRVAGVRQHVFVPAAPVQENTVGMHVVYQKAQDTVGVYLHYFDHLTYPQIAAVDVSPGTGKSRDPLAADLECGGGGCADEKMKKLEFGRVVPVYPGHYDIALGGKHFGLDAMMGESYAVLRLGDGDVVVYPPSQGLPTKSAATSVAASFALLVACVSQLL